MLPTYRIRAVVFCLALLPAALPAQTATPERNLHGQLPLGVRVHVRGVAQRGDTVTLAYAVENVRSGGEDFTALLVDIPAAVVHMPKPARFDWVTQPRYKGTIAAWVLVEDDMLHAGQTSPDLTILARGVPGLVRYWAVPDLVANPARFVDEDGTGDPYLVFADTGTTVGVVPVPAGATPASLVARLLALTQRACDPLGWISKAGICQSLEVKLTHAQSALVAGDVESARGDLRAFANELDAQHGAQPGKAVNDDAYALLGLNAAFLLAQL